MSTVARKDENDSVVVPAQVRLEHAAMAVLLERVVSLDQEVKDDLMAVLMDLPKGASAVEVAETEETLRELLYPELAGGLVVGKAGEVQPTPQLAAWTKSIGETIKNLRNSKGMTQDQLAEAAGLPQSHISRLEQGQHSPSHKTVVALAKALEVEVRTIDPGSE